MAVLGRTAEVPGRTVGLPDWKTSLRAPGMTAEVPGKTAEVLGKRVAELSGWEEELLRVRWLVVQPEPSRRSAEAVVGR